MKEGIKAGVDYEPVTRSVLVRELTSVKMEATGELIQTLKRDGVLFDSAREALAASKTGKIGKVEGLGGQEYYARSPQEAQFLVHNIGTSERAAFGRLQALLNTYVRNPSLINPLPHVTKNMFFKYMLAGGKPGRLPFDWAEYAGNKNPKLVSRFHEVMPFGDSSEPISQLMAKESGTWAQRMTAKGLRVNNFSSKFIFEKADPAMRYSLWKRYVRKGMSDQEAANHVWVDLVRYNENSGGMSFWKSIPFNFFVPWRVGTYVSLAKAGITHPIRTILFLSAVDYLREIRIRKSGRWTHMPHDYAEAPLAEVVYQSTKAKGVGDAANVARSAGIVAASTMIFGPGGGQAPSSISDVMAFLKNDPRQRDRVLNMFWGISQLYNIGWQDIPAYIRTGDEKHLVNILTEA